MKEITVQLKPGRDKPARHFHPWVFSGAIDLIDDNYTGGDLVCLRSHEGRFLGKGYLDTASDISVRLLSFEDIELGTDFFTERIANALSLREGWIGNETNAYRVINSEGDGLPGLVVDRYADYLIAQVGTEGMLRLSPFWLEALTASLNPRGIARLRKAGVKSTATNQLTALSGAAIPETILITENDLHFHVSVGTGQKTGFFLDQRENRLRVRLKAAGRRVLNTFAYTGGFSVAAVKGGALDVVSVDVSQPAMDLAKQNFEANGFAVEAAKFVTADVFDFLRTDTNEYDTIILDPPAFAKSAKQVVAACRGYKDINYQALGKIVHGGLLYTYSCSSYVSAELFHKVVFQAARDAGVDLQVIEQTAHSADHPVSVYHPEGHYLKGLTCRVLRR